MGRRLVRRAVVLILLVLMAVAPVVPVPGTLTVFSPVVPASVTQAEAVTVVMRGIYNGKKGTWYKQYDDEGNLEREFFVADAEGSPDLGIVFQNVAVGTEDGVCLGVSTSPATLAYDCYPDNDLTP